MRREHHISIRTRFVGTMLVVATGLLAGKASASWSFSGAVKNAAGVGLTDVAITVKDSAQYTAVMSKAGAFSLASKSSILDLEGRQSSMVRVDGNQLVIQGLVDGNVSLSLVDGSGRKLWSAQAVVIQGSARVAVPTGTKASAGFLRVEHQGGVLDQAVIIGHDGWKVAPHLVGARAMAGDIPTFVFTKAGYTTKEFTPSSASATGVTITLDSAATCELGTSFRWKDYGKPIAEPKNGWLAIKDFTMVRHNNQYIVYMTYTPNTAAGGFLAAYMTPFADFSQAAAATQAIMPNKLPGVAPELIYFTPKKTWVFTTQWCGGGFCYTTGSDPTNPTTFSGTTQSLLSENVTANAPIDQVVICDDANCFLFYADDKGGIFRGSMPKGSFPGKFSGTKRILQEADPAKLFEAVEVYKLKGQKKYLMIVECGYPRYFRAFTATDLGGDWTPVAKTREAATPFAGKSNVTNGWSNDISHGEIVRTGSDEYREIDPCNLQMIYQGLTAGGDYSKLPYRMGLITLTK